MLLEPELLEAVEADVHLVANLLSLSRVMPEKTKDTARQVVRRVVEELQRRLARPLLQAVRGSLNRAARNQPAAAQRDRLGPHHPRQPQALSARAPHDHPRDA